MSQNDHRVPPKHHASPAPKGMVMAGQNVPDPSLKELCAYQLHVCSYAASSFVTCNCVVNTLPSHLVGRESRLHSATGSHEDGYAPDVHKSLL